MGLYGNRHSLSGNLFLNFYWNNFKLSLRFVMKLLTLLLVVNPNFFADIKNLFELLFNFLIRVVLAIPISLSLLWIFFHLIFVLLHKLFKNLGTNFLKLFTHIILYVIFWLFVNNYRTVLIHYFFTLSFVVTKYSSNDWLCHFGNINFRNLKSWNSLTV